MRYTAIVLVYIVIAFMSCDSEDRLDTYLAEKFNARGMDDLVKDAIEDRTRYVGVKVTIKAKVKDTSTLDRLGFLTLETDNPSVIFIVDMTPWDYEKWDSYKKGRTYTFSLLILSIGKDSIDFYSTEYYILSEIVA